MASMLTRTLGSTGLARSGPLRPARTPLTVAPALKAGRRGRQLTVMARAEVQPMDRVLGALPYLLPFVDAWTYGRFLFRDFPALKGVFAPLFPVIQSYYGAGQYTPMLIFFALYIGVVQNKRLSNFVRFNAMQAVLLDVVLVLPRLLDTIISPPAFGWGAALYQNAQSLIWIAVTSWIVCTTVSSVVGKAVRIPYIADSADAQLN